MIIYKLYDYFKGERNLVCEFDNLRDAKKAKKELEWCCDGECDIKIEKVVKIKR